MVGYLGYTPGYLGSMLGYPGSMLGYPGYMRETAQPGAPNDARVRVREAGVRTSYIDGSAQLAIQGPV
eukprot:6655529-Pyramimonas_sp.AAC.2